MFAGSTGVTLHDIQKGITIMEVIDLTQTIHDDIQLYPGDPQPSITRYLTHEEDYCHVDLLMLSIKYLFPYFFIADGI